MKSSQWFHVRLKTTHDLDYFLDLDLQSLIRDVLIPIHTGATVFLQGRETSVGRLVSTQIVATAEQLQPRLVKWFEAQRIKPRYVKDSFCEDTRVFYLERDVTNRLMREFRESAEWLEIRRLLEQERMLRQEQASQEAFQQSTSGTSKKLQEVVDRIAYLAGIFMAGYTKF